MLRLLTTIFLAIIAITKLVGQGIVEAQFKGGSQGIINLIGEAKIKAKYNHCLMATTTVQFNVSSSGEIDSIKVIRGLGNGGADILKYAILKTSGNWIPATKNGIPINSHSEYTYFFNSIDKKACNDCKYWYELGIKEFGLQHYKYALKDFQNALDSNNGDADSYYYKALSELNLKNKLIEACQDLKDAYYFGKVEALILIENQCK